MIHVSDAFKEAWLNGNQKEILLNFSDGSTLTNDDVVSESFSLVQSVCEEEQITFGLTSSAQVSVQIYNSGKQYKGLTMSVTLIAGEYPMQIGVFKIDDDVRSDDRIYRTLTGYDALKDVLNNDYSAWHNALSSMTLKQYRDAFFSHIGISQVSTNLLNDGLTINIKTVQSLSGAEIIRYICEPNACFGFVNNVGMFQYTEPIGLGKHYPADDLYPANDLYPGDGIDVVMTAQDDELAPIMGGVVCSDYNTHRITQVRFNYSENTPEVTYGVPGNRYELTSNVLMYGQSESALLGVLQNFMSNVEGFFYTPGRLSGRARVWAQLGDIVGAAVKDMSVAFPILRRSMKGITALYDEYEARGKEYYTYSANTYERRITDAETASYEQAGQIDDINNDIEEIHENIGDLEITFEKTIDGLESRVAGSQKEWDTTGYNVTEFGYDSPTAEGYEPSEYTGEYYLNQTNGYLYHSNGSVWNLIKYCQTIQVALQSQITQTAGQINLKVSKNDVINQINLSSEGITIDGSKINISGNTTFTATQSTANSAYSTANSASSSVSSLSSGLYNGTTTINGGCITTGTVKGITISGCYVDATNTLYGSQGGVGNDWYVGNDLEVERNTNLYRLSVEGTAYLYSLAHGSTDNHFVRVTSNGELVYTTGAGTSSMRYKHDIKDVEDELLDPHKILKIPVRQFEYNLDTENRRDEKGHPVIGLIAEEVNEFYPRATIFNSYGVIENWDERYIIPPMLALIQEQQKKIEELENRIKILEEER